MAAQSRVITILSLLFLLSGVLPAQEATVATETSLRASPDSAEISAFLTARTPVEVLEHSAGWVRVRIEGWVRADVLGAGETSPAPSAPPTAVVPTSPPPAATARVSHGVTVEGVIRVELGRFKKYNAERAPVLLLPAGVEPVDAETDSTETNERIAELEAEAARLKREAEKAMHGPSFYESTKIRDEWMDKREVVLKERQEILLVRHGRHEAEVHRLALSTATTDSKGWFTLAGVAPGEYTVYARMTRENLDLEWIERLKVGGEPVRLDLDESKARGLLPD